MSDRFQNVLFLCTGNYYRSRFAEILFNCLAAQQGLLWVAESRGLRLHAANLGPLSPHAARALSGLGILTDGQRYPLQVSPVDFERADRIVALKQAEHRPLLQHDFPSWEHRVEYWHIHDVDCQRAEEALPELEGLVRELVGRLS